MTDKIKHKDDIINIKAEIISEVNKIKGTIINITCEDITVPMNEFIANLDGKVINIVCRNSIYILDNIVATNKILSFNSDKNIHIGSEEFTTTMTTDSLVLNGKYIYIDYAKIYSKRSTVIKGHSVIVGNKIESIVPIKENKDVTIAYVYNNKNDSFIMTKEDLIIHANTLEFNFTKINVMKDFTFNGKSLKSTASNVQIYGNFNLDAKTVTTTQSDPEYYDDMYHTSDINSVTVYGKLICKFFVNWYNISSKYKIRESDEKCKFINMQFV